MTEACLTAKRVRLADWSGRQEVKDFRHIVDIAKGLGLRAQIPEHPLGIGEVDAIDEGVVTSDSPGISEQLIFEADLDPAITARARTIYGVDWGIAGKIAKEGIAAIRLGGG